MARIARSRRAPARRLRVAACPRLERPVRTPVAGGEALAAYARRSPSSLEVVGLHAHRGGVRTEAELDVFVGAVLAFADDAAPRAGAAARGARLRRQPRTSDDGAPRADGAGGSTSDLPARAPRAGLAATLGIRATWRGCWPRWRRTTRSRGRPPRASSWSRAARDRQHPAAARRVHDAEGDGGDGLGGPWTRASTSRSAAERIPPALSRQPLRPRPHAGLPLAGPICTPATCSTTAAASRAPARRLPGHHGRWRLLRPLRDLVLVPPAGGRPGRRPGGAAAASARETPEDLIAARQLSRGCATPDVPRH